MSISLLYCSEKVVYSNEYMDDWEKFYETSLPDRFLQLPKHGRYYCCRLGACKKNLKRFKTNWEISWLHDLYILSHTLLLADDI